MLKTLRDDMSSESPLVVGLVQINNSFSGQNYLPYSVGLLQAYTMQNASAPSRYKFLQPIYKRTRIMDAVNHLIDADIVGFSAYVWNGRISLEIARRLKKLRPEIFIVFGGPHVPDKPATFLKENNFIDVVAHNEGERTFLAILERYQSNSWRSIPGISFLTSGGDHVRNQDGERFRDLDEIPSPFLDGIFDGIIQSNPEEHWIGLWETNRGCPFQCTFCDWGSATAAKVTKFGMNRLYREIDWFADNRIEYVFCCDANFGIQKRDVEIAEYVASVKKSRGYPHALSVQNTKNATERAYLTQKILSDAGLNKGVALSMQSVDSNTLTSIKRQNISLDTYLELQRRFTQDKVETYSDLILGLPGETYESFVNGVNLLMETGQHNRIQFNNLSILPNAEMGDPAYQEKYGMITVESNIINIHGERVEHEDDVSEVQQLVIATNACPLDDWRRVRAFCWMTALLHFDKLCQIPFIVMNKMAGITYREIIEASLNVNKASYPLIGDIRDFFINEAKSIQEGGPEYVFSKEWLGIYWPADEFIFIKLTSENNVDKFYKEIGALLIELLRGRVNDNVISIVEEAIELNRALLKQPFVRNNLEFKTNYNLVEYYQAVRNGLDVPLQKIPSVVFIDRASKVYDDFQEWCREVVWWGNKKGAYLYTNQVFDKQLAGHY